MSFRKIFIGLCVALPICLIAVVFLLARYRPVEPTFRGLNLCDLGIESYSKDPLKRAAAEAKLQEIGPLVTETVLQHIERHNAHGTRIQSLQLLAMRVFGSPKQQDPFEFYSEQEYRVMATMAAFKFAGTNAQMAAMRLEQLAAKKSKQDFCGCSQEPLSRAFVDLGTASLPSLARMLDRSGTSASIAMDALQYWGPSALPLTNQLYARLINASDQFSAQYPALALANIGPEGVDLLIPILSSGNRGQTLSIAEALFRAGESTRAGEALFTTVSDWTEPENKYGHEWPAIALATSGYKPDESAKIFSERLLQTERVDASYALALRLTGSIGLHHLAISLQSEDERTRALAAYALSCDIRSDERRPVVQYSGWNRSSPNDVFNYHLPPQSETDAREAYAAFKTLFATNDPEIESLAVAALNRWIKQSAEMAAVLTPLLNFKEQPDPRK